MRTATCAAGSEPRRLPRGFTLLELLVVLVIAGLMLGLVGPALPRVLPAAGFEAQSRELLARLRQARSQAILSRQSVYVSHDRQANALQFSHDGAPLQLAAGLSLEVESGAHDDPDAPPQAIAFHPDGHASGGTVVLGSADGRRFALRIDWLSGRVEREHD